MWEGKNFWYGFWVFICCDFVSLRIDWCWVGVVIVENSIVIVYDIKYVMVMFW